MQTSSPVYFKLRKGMDHKLTQKAWGFLIFLLAAPSITLLFLYTITYGIPVPKYDNINQFIQRMRLAVAKESPLDEQFQSDLMKKFDLDLHRLYWHWRRNKLAPRDQQKDAQQLAVGFNFTSGITEQDFFAIFQNLSLWTAESKKQENRTKLELNGTSVGAGKIGFGFGPYYNRRMMGQDLWAVVMDRFNPELFKISNKTKKISLTSMSDKPGENGTLRCPGTSLDKRCEIMNSERDDLEPRDVYILGQGEFPHPPLVSEDQMRIFYVLESPYHAGPANLWRRNDRLSSYWRGSELETPYGKWVYFDPAVRRMNQRSSKTGKNEKFKMAVSVISNCNEQNARLEYVRELQKYMSVDILGKCGQGHCEDKDGEKCFERLGREYRFYLAFENSNCRDYITEKFFVNALGNNMIPIVLGAHPDDYRASAPQNSYILVEDFESPEKLAQFLVHLAGNEDDYNKYFEWKGTGDFVSAEIYCRLCSLLFSEDWERRKGLNKSGGDLSWTFKNMCLKRGRWYWSRPNDPNSNSSEDYWAGRGRGVPFLPAYD